MQKRRFLKPFNFSLRATSAGIKQLYDQITEIKMTEVVIREVTEKDYDDVLKIRKPDDIYQGMDYLPDFFKMMIKLPGYKCYGAVVNGKLEAVVFVGIIDGGMSVIGRAGRVSKKYIGKGVYRKLDNFVASKYQAMPGILWCTATVNNENYEKNARKSVESKEYELIVEKVIHTYTLNVDTAKEQIKRITTPDCVTQLDHNDFVKLFSSDNTCRHLFPDDRIVIDKVPFRLIDANIEHILTERCTAVGSFLSRHGSSIYDQMLLSCSNFAVCAGGLLLTLDLYGRNISELKYHMVFHLRRIQHFRDIEIHLEVNCYEYVNKNDIGAALSTFGFKSIRFFRTHMYCVQIKYKDDPALYITKPKHVSKL